MKDAAVAIQRGNCTLLEKGIYAQNPGAKEVIIISNDTLVSSHWSMYIFCTAYKHLEVEYRFCICSPL